MTKLTIQSNARNVREQLRVLAFMIADEHGAIKAELEAAPTSSRPQGRIEAGGSTQSPSMSMHRDAPPETILDPDGHPHVPAYQPIHDATGIEADLDEVDVE